MQKLTKSEEEVMHLLWNMEQGTVGELLASMPEPRPPQSTLSSFIRILEKKGFVDHQAFGKVHVYFPIVGKKEYASRSLGGIVKDYFDGSAAQLVSLLLADEKLTAEEIAALRQRLDKLDEQ